MKALRFSVYLDRSGQYRWHVKAANGRILADSGEGYTRRSDAMKAARRFAAKVDGPVVVED